MSQKHLVLKVVLKSGSSVKDADAIVNEITFGGSSKVQGYFVEEATLDDKALAGLKTEHPHPAHTPKAKKWESNLFKVEKPKAEEKKPASPPPAPPKTPPVEQKP